MTTRHFSQPSARTFSVDDLVKYVGEGRVRIPEFQRPLRWQWEDVRRLFDSIVKGYPIGSLLLWQRSAPAGNVRLGAIVVDSPAFTDGWWVVDGQQYMQIREWPRCLPLTTWLQRVPTDPQRVVLRIWDSNSVVRDDSRESNC
jgi:hypothetical protein